jgi:hypothetical protein
VGPRLPQLPRTLCFYALRIYSQSGALEFPLPPSVATAPPERFEKRKQLVRLLMESIWLGKRQQDGRDPDNLPFRPAAGLRCRIHRRLVYVCFQER